MTQAVGQLDYARPRPSRRRARLRVAAILLAAAAVTVAAYHWGQPYYQHAQYLLWQRQCMSYERPATMIVYAEASNTEIEDWPRTRPGYVQFRSGGQWAVGHVPPVFRDERAPPLAAGVSVTRTPTPNCAVAFVHGRRNSVGRERLVVVMLRRCVGMRMAADGLHGIPADEIVLNVLSYEPAGWRSGQRMQEVVWAPRDDVSVGPCGAGLRLYAGQPDPADASRFSIAYDLKGDRSTVDGRLNDDDSVTLTVRPKP